MQTKACFQQLLKSSLSALTLAGVCGSALLPHPALAQGAGTVTPGAQFYVSSAAPGDVIQNGGAKLFTNISFMGNATGNQVSGTPTMIVKDVGGPSGAMPRHALSVGVGISGSMSLYIDANGQAFAYAARNLYKKDQSYSSAIYNGNASSAYLAIQMSSAPELASATKVGTVNPTNCNSYMGSTGYGWYLTPSNTLYRTTSPWNCYNYSLTTPSTGNVGATVLMAGASDVIQFSPNYLLVKKTNGDIYAINTTGNGIKVPGADWNTLKNNTGYYVRPGELTNLLLYKTTSNTWSALDVSTNVFLFSGLADSAYIGRSLLDTVDWGNPFANGVSQTTYFWWSGASTIVDSAGNVYSGVSHSDVQKVLGFVGVANAYLPSSTLARTRGALVYVNQSNQVVVHAYQGPGQAAPADLIVNFAGTTTVVPDNISALSMYGIEGSTANINGNGVWLGLRLADGSGSIYRIALDTAAGTWVTNTDSAAGIAKVYPGAAFLVSSMDGQVYAATITYSNSTSITRGQRVADSETDFRGATDFSAKKLFLYSAPVWGQAVNARVDGTASTMTPIQSMSMQYLDQPLAPTTTLYSYNFSQSASGFNGVWALNPYMAQAQGLDNTGVPYGWGYLTHSVSCQSTGWAVLNCPPNGYLANAGFRDPQPLLFGAGEAKVANFAAGKGAYNDKISLGWNAYPGATSYTITNNSASATASAKSWVVNAPATTFDVTTILNTGGTNVAPNVGTRFMIAASFNHPVYNTGTSTQLVGTTGNAGLTNTTASQCSTAERADPACGWLASGPTAVSVTGTVNANSAMNNLTANVTDPDLPNDSFTYEVLSQPAHGAAQAINSGATLQYQPNANYTGNDSFSFRVTDRAGNSLTSNASVTVSCPAPVISSVTMPTNPVGYTTSLITIQYTSNTCNGNLTATFNATNAGTGVPVSALDQSYSLTSTGQAATATFVLTNPAPASLNTTIKLASANFPANIGTSNGTLTINGYGNFALSLNKTIATEDDMITATVTQSAQTCTIQSAEDAVTNRQCYVHWTANPLLSATTPTPASTQGYLLTGANIPFAADVIKVDSDGAQHVLQTVNQVVTITAGSPMSVKPISFSKSIYRQYIDPIAIDIVRNSGYDCIMTSNPVTAQNNANQSLRSCLVEFPVKPAGLVTDPAGGPGLRGHITDLSTNGHVEWQVKKIYSAMPPDVMISGKFDIPVGSYSVAPAVGFDKQNYAVNFSQSKVTANVSGVTPSGYAACVPTASLSDAQASWTASTGPVKCLVEWTAIPAGLTAGVDANNIPQLTGVPTDVNMKTVAFKLSYVDAGGQKLTAGTASQEMGVVAIINPTATITATAGTVADSGQTGTTYLVPSNGGLGTFVVNSGDYATSKAIIVEDGAAAISITGLANGASRPLQLTPNKPAWYSRNVQFKLQYETVPNATPTTLNFRAVQLPSSAIKVALVPPTTALVDTQPFSLTIQVGELLSGTSLSYDAAKHGAWSGFIGAMVGGTLFPLTPSKPVDPNTGRITFTDLNYFDFAGQDVYAVAQATPPSNLTVDPPITIQTGQPLALTFKRGLALVASATVVKPTGPVPLQETLDLQISKDDAAALRSVVWQASSDGGTTWQPLGITGRGAKYTFTKGGSYLVRGLMTNTYSGIQSYTGAATVSAVELLKPTLTGNDYVLPGESVTLTASAKDGAGNLVSNFDTRWTVEKSDGSSSVVNGNTTITLTSDTVDATLVTLEVKAKTMPAEDPASWLSVTRNIVFAVPNAPKVMLSGPRSIEMNRSGHFTAKIVNPWPTTASTTLHVAGKWILPDGSENTNAEIDFIPLNATEPTQTLKYRAWVVGAEAQTAVESTISTTAWVYMFPTFVLKPQIDAMYAPAYLKLTIVPATLYDSKLLVGKKLSYSWTATGGLTFKDGATSMSTAISMPGTYDFTGKVMDDRGNVQEFSYQLDIANMKPYVFSFTTVDAIKFNRNPMTFAIKPIITGGHPKDRIISVTTTIDGVPVGSPTTKVPSLVVVPTSGQHEIGISFKSMMGAEASATNTVTVGVNKPPVCTPQILPMNPMTSKIISGCVDSDGKMARHAWSVDGVLQPKVIGPYIYYTLPADADSAVVSVTGTDDSGESTTAEVTVSRR